MKTYFIQKLKWSNSWQHSFHNFDNLQKLKVHMKKISVESVRVYYAETSMQIMKSVFMHTTCMNNITAVMKTIVAPRIITCTYI
jgi:hypothetical protein